MDEEDKKDLNLNKNYANIVLIESEFELFSDMNIK